MQKQSARTLLDCTVSAFAFIVITIIGSYIVSFLAEKTGNARLLDLGEGMTLMLIFSPLVLVLLFAVVSAPVLALYFALQQFRRKEWLWLITVVAGLLLYPRLSSYPLMFIDIAYYLLVQRAYLQDNAAPRSAKKWHAVFTVAAVLLFAWTYVLPMLRSPEASPENIPRRIVVQPSEQAQVPFSLATHMFPIPEGYAKTRIWSEGVKVLDIDDLTFSPDGTRVVFLVSIGSNRYVVVDGRVFPMAREWYDGQLDFHFTDDSEELLFIVKDINNHLYDGRKEVRQIGSFLTVKKRDDDTFITTTPLKAGETTYDFDGRRYTESDLGRVYDRTEPLQSPDGKRTAFVEQIGRCERLVTRCTYRVTVTESGQTVFQSRNYDEGEIHSLAFSADGKHIAYAVEGVKNFVAVDDEPRLVTHSIIHKSLRLSPDGKYVAYGATKGDTIWWIVEEVVVDPGNVTVDSVEKIPASASISPETSSAPSSPASPASVSSNGSPLTTPTVANMPFSSAYFTLSFKIPSGFSVEEDENHVSIGQSPIHARDIGDDTSFMRLTRYNEYDNREAKIALYRRLLRNVHESHTSVDGSSFFTLKGDDWGRYEGDSAGKVTVVFFDASWLEILERPGNSTLDFDPISLGEEILSTFRFSKNYR